MLARSSENSNIEINGTSSSFFVGRTLLSTMNHGYYITGSDYIEPGYIQVYDEEGNPIAEMQSGNQWGYIDHDGNAMAMFQDAGAFVNGYALVIEEGEAWIIDEEFHKLESLGQADSVSSMGEFFQMTAGDDVRIYQKLTK